MNISSVLRYVGLWVALFSLLGWSPSVFGQDRGAPVDSGASVNLRIQTDPPQVGLQVRAQKQGESAGWETETDANGVAAFTELPHGAYNIVFEKGKYQRSISTRLSSTGFQGENTLPAPERMQIQGPGEASGGSMDILTVVLTTEYLLYAALFILGGIAIVLGYLVLRTSEQSEETESTDPEERKEGEGKYEKKREIGAGGMATIWLAEEPDGRQVALKVMRESMLDDEELARKFVQEGEALERINTTHPEAPVVHVYNYGYLSDNQPFLALEYLPDRSLEQVVKQREALSATQALPVMRQVAMALSAAHANGVYHRDVKPENVIIVGRSSSLQIKLIDFGVARHEYVPHETMEGSLLGSPPYMSPEQASGGDIGPTSDIYSLGILSYALLAGEPPFLDKNPLRILEMHQEEEVPPLPNHVPAPVAQLVNWMLEKRPEDRPDQMWEVVGRLDELIADSASH